MQAACTRVLRVGLVSPCCPALALRVGEGDLGGVPDDVVRFMACPDGLVVDVDT
jgi:hypothetical protein